MICPPVWLCRCGCGGVTDKLIYDYPRQGYKAGEYRKYINGHNARGRKRAPETIAKMIATKKRNNKPLPPVSAETRKKLSEAGKRRHAHRTERYDGGHPNQRGRWSPEFREWRTAIFHRDRYTCWDCGKKGGRLNAHHLKSWAKYPELRFVLTNGITVCEDPCHKIRTKRDWGK